MSSFFLVINIQGVPKGDVVLTPTTVGINTILGQKDSTLQQNH